MVTTVSLEKGEVHKSYDFFKHEKKFPLNCFSIFAYIVLVPKLSKLVNSSKSRIIF